jgi:hypothetical protein
MIAAMQYFKGRYAASQQFIDSPRSRRCPQRLGSVYLKAIAAILGVA